MVSNGNVIPLETPPATSPHTASTPHTFLWYFLSIYAERSLAKEYVQKKKPEVATIDNMDGLIPA